jgi:hypothetical protein
MMTIETAGRVEKALKSLLQKKKSMSSEDKMLLTDVLRLALPVCFAKTLAGTKNGAVLGGVGLNMIIASIQHEDSGGQEPECA